MPTTSPVDVDAISESEFLAFVTRQLEEVVRNVNRASELTRDSIDAMRDSIDALGIPPKPRLALVKEGDDA